MPPGRRCSQPTSGRDPLDPVKGLLRAIKRDLDVIGSALEHLATKLDLSKSEKKILMKVSDLKNEVPAIRGQIAKISTEQQQRFDALSKKIEDLEKQISENDPELPEEVRTGFTEVKTLLQQLDDTILDPEGVPTDGSQPGQPGQPGGPQPSQGRRP